MSFGTNQLNSAVAQIDAKIAELEAAITSASSEAQARVSRDLKRAWESVANALSLSPTQGRMNESFATWAANSSPRVRTAPNLPLEPQNHQSPGQHSATQGPGSNGDGDAAAKAPIDMATATCSITCGQCNKDVEDVLWICMTCNGLHRMCNGCKAGSAGPCSRLGHQLVAWPLKARSLAADQYVICDHCKEPVVGPRWQCKTCPAFDSCNDCYVKKGGKDSHEHELTAKFLGDTEAFPKKTIAYSCSKCGTGITNGKDVVMCCLQCPDFHLCSACFVRGEMCNTHDYCALAQPGMSIGAVPAVSSPDATPTPEMGAKSPSVPFNTMHAKHHGKGHWKFGPPQASVVSAVCDSCNTVITSIRHKCTRCKDYDLCDVCYRDVSNVHPGHGFVHFGAPAKPPRQFPHSRPHPHPHPHPHHAGHGSPHHRGFKHNHREWGHAHHHGAHAGCYDPQPGKPPHGISGCRIVNPPFDEMPHRAAPAVGLPPQIRPLGCMMPRVPPPPPSVPTAECGLLPSQPKSAGGCSQSCCPRTGPATGMTVRVSVSDTGLVHEGVTCDACNMPIAGVRYKCGNCADYDLCEGCEARNEHNADHLFIKMRLPRRMMVNRPLLPMVYPSVASAPAPKPESAAAHPEDKSTADKGKESERSVPDSAMPVASAEAQPKAEAAMAPSAMHIPNAHPSPSATSATHPKNKHHVSETTQFSAVFVEDVTIPDGTDVTPDEKFVKIWSVANMGDSEWPKGTVIVHMGGAPTMTGIRNSAPIVVGKRYEQVGVAVDLQAPLLPGRYTSMWRLMTPQGQYFGSMLWCTIEVKAVPETKTAEVTASAETGRNLDAANPCVSETPSGLRISPPTVIYGPVVTATTTATTSVIPPPTATYGPIAAMTPAATSVVPPPPATYGLVAAATPAETGVSSPSTASIESLSNTFVKIGADLMSEIRRLEGSIKDLQLRQDKLESTSSSKVSLLVHSNGETSDKAMSTTSIHTADRAVGSSASAASSAAPTPAIAANHYSEIDLATSPAFGIMGAQQQQQQQQTSAVAPWSPSARSDASSMRDFYSSAARLENLLMSSRSGSRINSGSGSGSSRHESAAHTTHTSRTSLAFTDGNNIDDDAADEYELINDFIDHSSMSPHSHHM
ncbi:hypothetical protein LPJ53_005351 [Coemansia erecta]|uniref:ZZ-type domain-containing protein n=1 Tax=Coemansia erecta TaxID=147472 RepID=A0A9W7XVY0_9FUNG|nr:hypothetical protein LPJ53_005351 [Coemansia erecta]